MFLSHTDSECMLRINVSWDLLLKFKYIFVNHEFFIILDNVLVNMYPQKDEKEYYEAFILLSTIVTIILVLISYTLPTCRYQGH